MPAMPYRHLPRWYREGNVHTLVGCQALDGGAHSRLGCLCIWRGMARQASALTDAPRLHLALPMAQPRILLRSLAGLNPVRQVHCGRGECVHN